MSEPVFTVRGSDVLYRGDWFPRPTMEALLTNLRTRAADKRDWFHKDAKRLADELARAMDEADHERKVA